MMPISVFKHLIPILLLLAFAMLIACKDSVGPDDIPLPPPLPDDVALYVSMDGEGAGIWILNANSLALIDSMITRPGVPWTIEFSPDNKTLYSSWHGTPSYLYNLHAVNLSDLTVSQSIQLLHGKYAVATDVNKLYLIAYGSKGIQVFERATLNLIFQDTSSYFGLNSRIVASKNHNRIYFAKWENGQVVGFGTYDLDLHVITDSIIVFNANNYPGLQPADLSVSPDDRFLFFSVWNWRGGGGFNTFFVIDISEGRIIAEYPCGHFARLAVSPDGKSVYISKAGDNIYILPPNNHPMYRFDVQTKTMNDFKNRGGGTGIAIAEDNRTMFISDNYKIEKVDALSGKIIASYTIPLDSLGRLTSHIRNIRLGKY